MQPCLPNIKYSSQCINGRFSAAFCPYKVHASKISGENILVPLCKFELSAVAPVCMDVLNQTYPIVPGTVDDIDVSKAFNDCFGHLLGYTLDKPTAVELCDVQNWPVVCMTPSFECSQMKLAGIACEGESLQGIEPELCPPKYYCSNLMSAPIICPAGYYCPQGTSIPNICPPISFCPEGSRLPSQFLPLVLMILIDIAIFTFIFYYRIKGWCERPVKCKESCTNCDSSSVDCKNNDCKCKSIKKERESEKNEFPNQPLLSSKYELFVALDKASLSLDKVHKAPVIDTIVEENEKENKEKENKNENGVSQINTAEEGSKLPKALLKGFAHGRDRVVELGFTFNDLSLVLQNGKEVLHGVTGEVLPGHVTAVMGGSGSGKSTLLGTLRGKIPSGSKRTGLLKINGKEAAFKEYKRVVGFVPQEDVMLRELTVRDNVTYSAFIRLPSWTVKQRNEFIDAVLEALHLKHVADSVIGDEITRGISGGERKRVNIAIELSCGVVGLFLDEPTSGLDSTGARAVCLTLSNLAHQVGITVVMVIHQPRIDIFRSMDDLILLAPGGYIVYHGPINQVEDYFVSLFKMNIDPVLNPADLIIDFITLYKQESIDKWKQQVVLAEQLNVKPHVAHKKIALAIKQTSTTILDNVNDDQSNVNEANKIENKNLHEELSLGSKIAEIIASADITKSSDDIKLQLTELIKSAGLIGNPSVLADVLLESLMDENSQNPGSSSEVLIDKQKIIFQLQNERKGAGIPYQIFGAFGRSMLQNYRTPKNLMLQSAISFVAGIAISAALEIRTSGYVNLDMRTPVIAIAVNTSPGFQIIMVVLFTNIAIALVSIPPSVNHFGAERAVYFREASVGHNRFSYFVGKDIAGMCRITLDALHFTAGMLLFPTSLTFFDCYSLVWVMMYCIYSIGYFSSQVVPLRMAGLFGIVLTLVISIFNGFIQEIPLQLRYVFFTWWCSNYFFIAAIKMQSDIYNISMIASGLDYDLETSPALLLLYAALFGILMRVISFLLLIGLHRDQQR